MGAASVSRGLSPSKNGSCTQKETAFMSKFKQERRFLPNGLEISVPFFDYTILDGPSADLGEGRLRRNRFEKLECRQGRSLRQEWKVLV